MLCQSERQHSRLPRQLRTLPELAATTRLAASVWLVSDVSEGEQHHEGAVWRAESVAVCAALGVLLVNFGGYLAMTALLPEAADWIARTGSAVAGFWLATRAYRGALRSRGFTSTSLGVPLRHDRATTGH